jgi:hypothetical protein
MKVPIFFTRHLFSKTKEYLLLLKHAHKVKVVAAAFIVVQLFFLVITTVLFFPITFGAPIQIQNNRWQNTAKGKQQLQVTSPDWEGFYVSSILIVGR